MATHSRTLAWKIPWTEEPGRLQSHGVAKNWTQLCFSSQGELEEEVCTSRLTLQS